MTICVPNIPLSSPGLTGRPSTPRLLDSISGFPAYWISAFAGMTVVGENNEDWPQSSSRRPCERRDP